VEGSGDIEDDRAHAVRTCIGGGLRALDPGSSSIILANIATGDVARGTERVRQRYGEDAGVLSPERPIAIVGYQDVRETPLVLAVLLGFLGMGILAHVLVSSTRRRARDLAVLRTFGFTRRQVWGAVAWQATTLVALALPVALVLGVVLGRWAWKLFADGLGLVSEPVVPVLAVAITAVLALLVANLVAVFPARTAARTRAALVLRSE